MLIGTLRFKKKIIKSRASFLIWLPFQFITFTFNIFTDSSLLYTSFAVTNNRSKRIDFKSTALYLRPSRIIQKTLDFIVSIL